MTSGCTDSDVSNAVYFTKNDVIILCSLMCYVIFLCYNKIITYNKVLYFYNKDIIYVEVLFFSFFKQIPIYSFV